MPFLFTVYAGIVTMIEIMTKTMIGSVDAEERETGIETGIAIV